jgi:hypothetical protein
VKAPLNRAIQEPLHVEAAPGVRPPVDRLCGAGQVEDEIRELGLRAEDWGSRESEEKED